MRLWRYLFFFFVIPSLLLAQNYLWPTSASKYLSASFCEYRPGHYHSAIDIKTWNREGYPVYAVEQGWLYRVRVSPKGYGKAIYLKLKDGRFAVYAHLQRFSDEIEQAVRKIQLKRKRYSIDWKPNHWPAKKGECIAYTGQTGIGVPHLHFEIRDAHNHPINPLQFFKNIIKDTRPPVLKELLVIPLNKNSSVNGSVLPAVIPLKKADDHYAPAQPIFAHGKIGLAIRGYDRADGVFNKYGFYREKVFWDGQLIFSAHYDTLDFAKTNQIDVEIYYPFRVLRGKRFRKLFKEPFNQLNFFRTNETGGMVSVKHKAHPFKIVISDFWNNQSIVQGIIKPEAEITAQLLYVKHLKNQLFLKLNVPRHLKQLELWQANNSTHWQKIKFYEILEQTFTNNYQQMLLRTTLSSNSLSRLKVKGQTIKNDFFSLVHDFSIPRDSLRVNLYNLGKFWVLRLKPAQNLNSFTLNLSLNGQPVQPIMHFNGHFAEWVIAPGQEQDQTLHIQLQKFETILFDSTIHFYTLFPGRVQQFRFFNDSLRLFKPAKAIYDTLIFTVNQHQSTNHLNNSPPTFSPKFAFNWYPQPLAQPLQLEVKLNPFPFTAQKLAFYTNSSQNRFEYLGGVIDSTLGMARLSTKSLPSFVVGADTIPPTVKILKPAQNQTLGALKFVKILVDDSLSGLDSDRNFRIFIDKQWLIPEWDPERKLILARLYWPLSNGEHQLEVEVTDRAGNNTRQSINFTVKR